MASRIVVKGEVDREWLCKIVSTQDNTMKRHGSPVSRRLGQETRSKAFS